MKNVFRNFYQAPSKAITILAVFGLITAFAACSSSTSADDEEGPNEKETRTFEVLLAADGSTQVGTATTEIITPEDDAFIDEGFFITLDISSSDNFEPTYEINMNHSSGLCGTWDVQNGEKAEMPCDYDEFLDDPTSVIVTSEDGSGVDAYLE